LQEFQKKHPEIRCQLITQYRTGVKELFGVTTFSFGCDWDDSGKVAKRLNTFFFPRLYLLDKDKRVLYVQPSGTVTANALSEIEKIVQSRKEKDP
jgi:hypothetical protein